MLLRTLQIEVSGICVHVCMHFKQLANMMNVLASLKSARQVASMETQLRIDAKL